MNNIFGHSEKLKDNEIDLAFYYYKVHMIGSHDSYNRDEIIVKDAVSLSDQQK